MSKLKIRQGDWVIVCDGRKALVLENAGDEKFLNLKTREVFDHPDQKTSELVLQTLAGHLDAELKAGRTKSIVIVAPPRALGVLRPAYSHDVRKALLTEIDKDLVALPLHEIEKHLMA